MTMNSDEKIVQAITLLETMTRSQYLTGAITSSNTNIILAIQLLRSLLVVKKPRKQRITKPKTNLESEKNDNSL
jgi:hypothetical protein